MFGTGLYRAKSSVSYISLHIPLEEAVYELFRKPLVRLIRLIKSGHEFYKQVSKVALTDSWTISKGEIKNQMDAEWIRRNFIHYVASN
jgi:hypothetical protein